MIILTMEEGPNHFNLNLYTQSCTFFPNDVLTNVHDEPKV